MFIKTQDFDLELPKEYQLSDDSFLLIINNFKTLLISGNRVKPLLLKKKSDIIFECQPLLLTYHNNQIKVKIDHDFKELIDCKKNFLKEIKTELGQPEKHFDQQLLNQFYDYPTVEKLVILLESYQQLHCLLKDKDKKEYQPLLIKYLQVNCELQLLQLTQTQQQSLGLLDFEKVNLNNINNVKDEVEQLSQQIEQQKTHQLIEKQIASAEIKNFFKYIKDKSLINKLEKF
jgi:hypothetical protein